MRGQPTTWWGKLQRSEHGPVEAWHPLVDHCADVAACAVALLDLPTWRRRLGRLADQGTLDERQCARLAALIALHDVGKFNHGFQAKSGRGTVETAGHVGEVLALFQAEPEAQQLAEALGYMEMVPWAVDEETLGRLLMASICHHGEPHAIGGSVQRARWAPRGGVDPMEGIAALATAMKQWLPEAFAAGGRPLPASPPLQHGVCGLAVLADWLGSDTRFFPYSEPGDPERFAWALGRAREAIQTMGLDPSAARRALGAQRPGFEQVSPHPPRAMQAAVVELRTPEERSTVVLEAATGSGKTEAALVRYLQLFQAGAVDGMYIALPTRTAATQLHRRVVEAVVRMFPEVESRPPVVLAVPGYLAVDDAAGVRLPEFKVLWPDRESERWRARAWAAEGPKRFLVGAVVVGTIDQVLLSTLRVRHSHLRASALMRHFLVVDEVHASDAYMTAVLEAVLARHLGAGGHALLMSATLGEAARALLLRPGERARPEPLERALQVPYPALHLRVGTTEPAPPTTAQPVRRCRVRVRRAPWAGLPGTVAEQALGAAMQGARVLVLRNTVRMAVETLDALVTLAEAQGCTELLWQCAGAVAPHHARFAKRDREALDTAIEEAFGKNRPMGGCVAVATQTVQQSLDLDADWMLTDLCPMDVLLQRIGRLHRHHRTGARPQRWVSPEAVVLTPESRALEEWIDAKGQARGEFGLGTVYCDLRIIESTWRELEHREFLAVPEDCREVVERTTHPEALDALVAELGGRWEAHAAMLWGTRAAHRRQADLGLVPWQVAFGSEDTLFPRDLQIPTRLGESDRQVEFAEPMTSPFGREVRRLRVPAWLARGAEDVEEATEVAPLESGGARFALGPLHFVYDAWGLRPEAKEM